MVRKLINVLFAMVVLLGLNPELRAQQAEVIASVDKNPIIQSEPFTLTVTVNDDVSQSAWQPEQDLRDFRILNTRSSRRTSVINGATTRTTSFIVNLQAPKTPGIVRIPPIQIGAARSEPIELTILDAASSVDDLEQRPAFIRTSLEAQQVYVQQQVKLVARLYLSANLQSGNLIAPALEDAEISQFGKDEESYEIINGKRYQVFQRTYLITPQRSGDLTIEGPVFEGQISRETGRSVFSSIATTQPVSTVAVPQKITVLPRPNDWQGHWLPAELVSFSVEHNSESHSVIKVGEPLTLTYRITAIGVSPEHLPDIKFEQLEGVSSYPESPELGSTTRNGKVIAQRSQTVAIIPRNAGELTIPAISIPWFNTRLQQQQVAQSEVITVNVEPASGLQQQPPSVAETAPEESSQVSTTEPPVTVTALSSATQSLYFWLALGFAALWLLTLCIWATWWWRQQRTASTAVATAPQPPSHAWQQLQRAAQKNDALATEQALRAWAQHQLKLPVHDLTEISEHFNHQPLRSQIDHLQRCRYAGSHSHWLEGKALLRALKGAQKSYRPAPVEEQLPTLYP